MIRACRSISAATGFIAFLACAECLSAPPPTAPINAAAKNYPAICEQAWTETQSPQNADSWAVRANKFAGFTASCAGSGIYEERLADLYIEAKDSEKAKQVLEHALNQNMPYRKELLGKEADMYRRQQDLATAERKYTDLISRYPDYYAGYSGLGTILLVQHFLKESVANLEKANSLQPARGAYRNLVLAYFLEARYQDALDAYDKYFRLNGGTFDDRDATMALAVSCLKLGKLEMADGALRALMKAKPQVKEDKQFVDLFHKIQKGLSEKE